MTSQPPRVISRSGVAGGMRQLIGPIELGDMDRAIYYFKRKDETLSETDLSV